MTEKELCALALKAMEGAYAPYSGYKVGAALLAESGKVYLGCNIENASFSPTVCAERTAFFKAVSEGERGFSMLAVCGGRDGRISGAFPPCGVCRQVMAEFCGRDFPVLVVISQEEYSRYALSELLPLAFMPSHLSGRGESKA